MYKVVARKDGKLQSMFVNYNPFLNHEYKAGEWTEVREELGLIRHGLCYYENLDTADQAKSNNVNAMHPGYELEVWKCEVDKIWKPSCLAWEPDAKSLDILTSEYNKSFSKYWATFSYMTNKIKLTERVK